MESPVGKHFLEEIFRRFIHSRYISDDSMIPSRSISTWPRYHQEERRSSAGTNPVPRCCWDPWDVGKEWMERWSFLFFLNIYIYICYFTIISINFRDLFLFFFYLLVVCLNLFWLVLHIYIYIYDCHCWLIFRKYVFPVTVLGILQRMSSTPHGNNNSYTPEC